jgi:heme/copper-type cytochrome/quinol oxidase subunit 2
MNQKVLHAWEWLSDHWWKVYLIGFAVGVIWFLLAVAIDVYRGKYHHREYGPYIAGAIFWPIAVVILVVVLAFKGIPDFLTKLSVRQYRKQQALEAIRLENERRIAQMTAAANRPPTPTPVPIVAVSPVRGDAPPLLPRPVPTPPPPPSEPSEATGHTRFDRDEPLL